MNYLMEIAFNGGAYHGFQVQKNAVSVCAVLQDAMEKVLGDRPDVKGCSRTDSGVHARGYCVNFHHTIQVPLQKIPLAFNRFLPPDIRVKKVVEVPEDFHARYASTGKEYHYVILNGSVDDPFCTGQYYRLYPRLDEQAMNRAARYLIGRHDFAAFMSAGSDIEDTVRTVTMLEVARDEDWVVMRIAADGFLYNMVRIIAGTLVRAGLGKTQPEEVERILLSKDRGQAGDTMPAKGLFLHKVFYPQARLLGCMEKEEG